MYRCVEGYCVLERYLPFHSREGVGIRKRAADTLNAAMVWCLVRDSGVSRNFVRGGSTNSVENRGQREQGSGGGRPLVRGSGGSCNFVQEISFHIVKFSQFLVL